MRIRTLRFMSDCKMVPQRSSGGTASSLASFSASAASFFALVSFSRANLAAAAAASRSAFSFAASSFLAAAAAGPQGGGRMRVG